MLKFEIDEDKLTADITQAMRAEIEKVIRRNIEEMLRWNRQDVWGGIDQARRVAINARIDELLSDPTQFRKQADCVLREMMQKQMARLLKIQG